jgi:hypothetical protein
MICKAQNGVRIGASRFPTAEHEIIQLAKIGMLLSRPHLPLECCPYVRSFRVIMYSDLNCIRNVQRAVMQLEMKCARHVRLAKSFSPAGAASG